LLAVGAAEVVAGRAAEVAVAVQGRPRQAVRLRWAEAWAAGPDPRLARRAVRVERLALARAAQCVRARAARFVRERAARFVRERAPAARDREPAPVARDREPARADQAETLPGAAAPLPAN
jgi:hypothetical protein